MGQTINTGGASKRPPAVKLQTKGDQIKFAVISLDLDLPVFEYGTDRRAFTVTGKPKTQHALRVLVVDPGDGKISIGDGEYAPLEADSEATIYIAGHTKWDPDGDKQTAPFLSWGGALDELGSLEVGTVGVFKFVDEVAGKGSQPKRMRRFRLRAAYPAEGAVVARCEELAAAADMSGGREVEDDHGDMEDPF